MMMRFSTLLIALLVAVTGANRSSSEERTALAADRPMSVFNHQIRRFKFHLEDMLITAETAEMFMLQHQARNEPEIIGAYADAKTNSLVIIGPPDAEHSIRVTLAKWIVDRQGASPQPLNVQKRTLEFRRKELLREMAELEVQIVGDENKERAKQVHARTKSTELELNVVEKQIQVVVGYIRRLNDTAYQEKAETADR